SVILSLGGCSSSAGQSADNLGAPRASSPGPGTGASGGGGDHASPGAPAPGRGPTDSAGPASSSGSQEDAGAPVVAGQLTAGDWDDNLNFTFFRQYASAFAQQHPEL